MRRIKKLNPDIVREALEAESGIVTYAAERIGVTAKCIHDWLVKDEALAAFYKAISEKNIDKAEHRLGELMDSRDENIALGAVKFYLEHKGHSRGYGRLVNTALQVNNIFNATGKVEDVPTDQLIELLRNNNALNVEACLLAVSDTSEVNSGGGNGNGKH